MSLTFDGLTTGVHPRAASRIGLVHPESVLVPWTGRSASDMTSVYMSGSQTLVERPGTLSVKFSGQSTQDFNSLLIPYTMSTGDMFAVPVFMYAPVVASDVTSVGIVMTDGTSSTSNAITYHIQHVGAEESFRTYMRSGTLTAMSSPTQRGELGLGVTIWLGIEYDAANTFKNWVSVDGLNFVQSSGSTSDSKTMTPTHVGICWSKDASANEGLVSFGPLIKAA